MTRPLAIAGYAELPELHEDDRPLIGAFAAAGIPAVVVRWDAQVDWANYRAVIIRETWDYYRRPSEFRAWLDRLERLQVPLWNPPPLVRWNLEKTYLRDLQSRGVPVVETRWFVPGEDTADTVIKAIADLPWPEIILKPTISAGGWQTLRVHASEIAQHEAALADVLGHGGLMVQPFVPEIVTEGEYSFLFFGGEFSHAVLKRPRAGDFRVQWRNGGTHEGIVAPPSLLAQAREILAASPDPGLYARVDGVVQKGKLLLMELEQIEPYLFFAESDGAMDRYVRAVMARI